MNVFKRCIVTFLLSCVIMGIRAQFVNYGTDPWKYKWNIVTTDHYKVIFPVGTDSMAYRYARLLETYHPYVQNTIGRSSKKNFPVILHPGNMLSNGMVAWAPRRMEIIPTPSPDLYAQIWDRQLVVHESRHVFQTRQLNHGIFKPLSFLIGEQSSGIAAFLVPTWFFEGDAVVTETALSGSGRGRLPEFNMIYRAQLATGNFYSFDKWFLGSYKDYTGTKYALGYDITAYARYKHGADVWGKITETYAKRIYNIPPFSKAIKRHTGSSKNELFKNTFEFLNEEWKIQEEQYRKSGFQPSYITPSQKVYTTYKYPQAIDNETIIAVKTSLDDINSLVLIRQGTEKRLTYLGSINSKIIHNNNRIYWTEYVSGLRWTHENYSVLKYYDMTTGKVKTVSNKERFQAPAISKDGKTAAVSEFTETGNSRIVVISTDNGERITAYPLPFNTFAKDIVFTDTGYLIACTIDDDGISLWHINATDGTWKRILEPTRANITSLFWGNNELLFESGADGTNNIYSLKLGAKTPQKITTARFGAFTPALSPDNSRIIFSDYQAEGYRLATVPTSNLKKEPVDFNDPYRFALAETIRAQEQANVDTLPLRDIEFNPRRYHRLPHLFKIHSWTPFYYDASDIIDMNFDDFSTIIKPGAMVLSQNSLNTAISQLGWYYKDGNHHGKLSFTYMGWYPVINFDIDYGGDAFNLRWRENEQGDNLLTRENPGRNLIDAEALIYIPFNLTRNHYVRGIQPAVTYLFTNNKYEQISSGKLDNFQYILPEIRFYNYRRMSMRDILPKWGYQLRLQHLSMIGNKDNYGKLYAARLTTYLPGLFKNNSFMLRAGYQYQDIDDKVMYIPKKLLNQPRGLHYSYYTHQQVELKADYAFSFAHPDWSLGSFIYIKRIRANLFYDINLNKPNKEFSWENESSAGADLIFDWNGLQAEFPLATGLRLIKPIKEDGLEAEILFSISF